MKFYLAAAVKPYDVDWKMHGVTTMAILGAPRLKIDSMGRISYAQMLTVVTVIVIKKA